MKISKGKKLEIVKHTIELFIGRGSSPYLCDNIAQAISDCTGDGEVVYDHDVIKATIPEFFILKELWVIDRKIEDVGYMAWWNEGEEAIRLEFLQELRKGIEEGTFDTRQ